MSKRKVKAKEFAKDVASGLHRNLLMAKYDLSPSQLDGLLEKLKQAGFLPDIKPSSHSSTDPKPTDPARGCPKCELPLDEGMSECPRCGLVISKSLSDASARQELTVSSLGERTYDESMAITRHTPMKHQGADFAFSINEGREIPEWIQWIIVSVIMVLLVYFALKPAHLETSGKMTSIAEQIRQGSVETKNRAIAELEQTKAVDAASVTNLLIDIIDDETPADLSAAAQYHARRRQLAGGFSDSYVEKDVTIGDLAASALRRVRQNMIIECVGDGPGHILAAVRKSIFDRLVPRLCSANETVKLRIIDVLQGDSVGIPAKTVVECCLDDSSPKVRAFSTALFITYGHADRSRAMIAVPKLIELVGDTEYGVSKLAQTALKAISGQDLGTDTQAWKDWFSKNSK